MQGREARKADRNEEKEETDTVSPSASNDSALAENYGSLDIPVTERFIFFINRNILVLLCTVFRLSAPPSEAAACTLLEHARNTGVGETMGSREN